MWIYDPNRQCLKCGKKDTAFFAQRGKASKQDPKRQRISINNTCHVCKSKERQQYYYRHGKLALYHKDNIFMTEKI